MLILSSINWMGSPKQQLFTSSYHYRFEDKVTKKAIVRHSYCC
jgi:hypothetical protein